MPKNIFDQAVYDEKNVTAQSALLIFQRQVSEAQTYENKKYLEKQNDKHKTKAAFFAKISILVKSNYADGIVGALKAIRSHIGTLDVKIVNVLAEGSTYTNLQKVLSYLDKKQFNPAQNTAAAATAAAPFALPAAAALASPVGVDQKTHKKSKSLFVQAGEAFDAFKGLISRRQTDAALPDSAAGSGGQSAYGDLWGEDGFEAMLSPEAEQHEANAQKEEDQKRQVAEAVEKAKRDALARKIEAEREAAKAKEKAEKKAAKAKVKEDAKKREEAIKAKAESDAKMTNAEVSSRMGEREAALEKISITEIFKFLEEMQTPGYYEGHLNFKKMPAEVFWIYAKNVQKILKKDGSIDFHHPSFLLVLEQLHYFCDLTYRYTPVYLKVKDMNDEEKNAMSDLDVIPLKGIVDAFILTFKKNIRTITEGDKCKAFLCDLKSTFMVMDKSIFERDERELIEDLLCKLNNLFALTPVLQSFVKQTASNVTASPSLSAAPADSKNTGLDAESFRLADTDDKYETDSDPDEGESGPTRAIYGGRASVKSFSGMNAAAGDTKQTPSAAKSDSDSDEQEPDSPLSDDTDNAKGNSGSGAAAGDTKQAANPNKGSIRDLPAARKSPPFSAAVASDGMGIGLQSKKPLRSATAPATTPAALLAVPTATKK